jgi:hypothetical protein
MGFILLQATIKTFHGDGGKTQCDKNRSANLSQKLKCPKLSLFFVKKVSQHNSAIFIDISVSICSNSQNTKTGAELYGNPYFFLSIREA